MNLYWGKIGKTPLNSFPDFFTQTISLEYYPASKKMYNYFILHVHYFFSMSIILNVHIFQYFILFLP